MSVKDSDTIYVTVGRGSGKLAIQAAFIESLRESGKKVVLIEPKLNTESTKRLSYVDMDILSPESMERADQILNEILKGEK